MHLLFHIFQADITLSVALLMAPKDESEIKTIKKACQATVDLYSKYLKEQLIEIIDKDKVSIFHFMQFYFMLNDSKMYFSFILQF